ncbi:hypothetical protein Leryth_016101 [Lithospermum erythrorhizon]|nr:hypothetical protein Leryth_016101 [Lithospermum erythrorhizon]
MQMGSIVTPWSKDEEEDGVSLPGFRFHPTDEELVGFYLKRKIEKRPIRIELIKQIDIYKYDPWDLPRRKYRNSIRPNRVTGSGFWKATGIDKPIYSKNGDECIIGLKKSLVYYRGSAGKGSKTDWMMHEFRLPADHDIKNILRKHQTIYLIGCNNHDTTSRQTNYISFNTINNNPIIWQNNEKINRSLSANHEREPLIITSYYQHHHGLLTNYQPFNSQISLKYFLLTRSSPLPIIPQAL